MPGPRPRPLPGDAAHGPRIWLSVERSAVMRLARTVDNRAWLPGVYGAIYRANLAIAREGQRLAVQNIDRDIIRPEQRTGLLEKAVGDPQAVYADGQRIILGVGDYLDSVARYWRPVETGAPGMEGEVFTGAWTRAPRFDDHGGPSAGNVPLEPPIEGEKSGRPILFKGRFGSASTRGGAGFAFRWVVRNPPQGKWYFRNAWQELQQGGFVERAYRSEVSKVIGPNGRPLHLGSLFSSVHGRAATSRDFTL